LGLFPGTGGGGGEIVCLAAELLLLHRAIHTAEDDGVGGVGEDVLGENAAADLVAVLVDHLGCIAAQSVGALHQGDLLAGGKGAAFVALGLKGKGLLIGDGFCLGVDDADIHAVVGFGVQGTGEDVIGREGEIQRVENVGHGAAVG